jgi:hypothetical protein
MPSGTPQTEPPPTCERCDRISTLRESAAAAGEFVDGRRKSQGELEVEATHLEVEHPKCKRCGIYFGGTHSGSDVGEGHCGRCAVRYALKDPKNKTRKQRETYVLCCYPRTTR